MTRVEIDNGLNLVKKLPDVVIKSLYSITITRRNTWRRIGCDSPRVTAQGKYSPEVGKAVSGLMINNGGFLVGSIGDVDVTFT